MDKPASLRCAEFSEGLAALINNSGLPAFVMEPIMKNVYYELVGVCRTQMEKDRKIYLQSLQDEEAGFEERGDS